MAEENKESKEKWYVGNNRVALIGRGESVNDTGGYTSGQVGKHKSSMTHLDENKEYDADGNDPNDEGGAEPMKDVEEPIDEAAEEEKIESLKPSVGCFCPKVKLAVWEPENDKQWDAIGKRIATRNLFASIPNLTCGFGVWLVWSVLASKIQLMHDEDPSVYAFSDWGSPEPKEYKVLLYTLPAVAGLSGGTLRIPNSFMTQVSGGRNVVYSTSVLLCIPMILVGIAMTRSDCPFNVLIAAALLSGVGGGSFASSMSNISFYYPKRQQGYALGMNGGIGNLGVSISQLLAPIFMSTAFGVSPVSPAGITGWPANAGWLWLPLCAASAIAAFFWMSNQPQHGEKSTLINHFYYYWMEILGMIAALCGVIVLVLTRDADFIKTAGGAIGQKFLLVFICLIVEHFFMYFVVPSKVKTRVKAQIVIFKRKHTYIMTWLYIMCFGSFIGYSGAFPKLITDLFGYVRGCVSEDGELTIGGSEAACEDAGGTWSDDNTNPNAPNVFAYAWLGAAVGSLIRPVGGTLSDKFGGAKVTMVCIIWCTIAAFAQGVLVNKTRQLDRPEENFGWFVFLQLNLFLTTGAMNGSTFRTIGVLFPPEEAGPVLGWSSAIASYGAFIIPAMFGIAIKDGYPETTFYCLGGYYISCGLLNLWYYVRPGAEKVGV